MCPCSVSPVSLSLTVWDQGALGKVDPKSKNKTRKWHGDVFVWLLVSCTWQSIHRTGASAGPPVSSAESVHCGVCVCVCVLKVWSLWRQQILQSQMGGRDYTYNPFSLPLSGPLVLDTLPRLAIDLWRLFLDGHFFSCFLSFVGELSGFTYYWKIIFIGLFVDTVEGKPLGIAMWGKNVTVF